MHQRITNIINRFLPEPLNLHPIWITLDSGFKVCIDSKLTLDMFAELFITQPYAPALNLASETKYVVDLGSNHGLFLLFMSHYLRKQGKEAPQFVCVEASKENFMRLMDHVRMNGLTGGVAAVCGAVCGQRSGAVQMYYAPRAHGMASIVKGRRLSTRSVPVIDLTKVIEFPRIDVLKVDVEGAEEAVLQEYPSILAKTQVLLAEFHLKQIDYERCRAILKDSGLLFHTRTFQFEDRLCVDVYARAGVK